MSKFFTSCFAFALLCCLTSAESHDRGQNGAKALRVKAQETESFQRLPLTPRLWRGSAQPFSPNQPNDVPVHLENFDAGAPGWKYQDLWSESSWHTTTTGAFSGKSYWCAEELLGGYDDAWLQTLTSPAIHLPQGGGILLSFMHKLSVEPLSGGGYPAGYDAWDAVTVRLSTDGETFNVISPRGGPAYHAASAYAFHFYYGSGVAGWGGSTGGYVSSTFDLSAFAGQTVWVRFEFASDETFSHAEDVTLEGWRIDDIKITQGATTVFSDDGGDTGAAQFTAGGPGGPSQWRITNVAAQSAPNSAGCLDPASGNYLSNSKTALVSPTIPIDNLPATTRQLIVDFQVQGTIDPEVGAEGNQDFMNIEFRSYSNGKWSYWNTTGSAVAGLPGTFASFNASYPTDMDLTPLVGAADSMQMRIVFYSAPDGAVAAPANVFVDDFAITAVTTLANDVSLVDLDVPFPNLVAFATQTGIARVANVGLNNQPTVLVRHRVNEGAVILPVPPTPVNVAAGAQANSIFGWKAPEPGDYKLTALTTLGQDENRANDSLSVAPITVYPDGLAELGYDDRFLQDQFITRTTSLVAFTVLSDLGGVTNSYDLRRVKIDLFNGSETEDHLRIVIATASDDTTLMDVLLDVTEPVPAGDFSSHFFDVNAFNLTAERFVVLLDFSVSAGNAAVVMDARTRFVGHNFAHSGNRWVGSTFGRQVRAWVTWLAAPDILSVRDVPNDQGRQAHVVWFPSPNEAFTDELSHYVLWRAVKDFGAASADANYRMIRVPSIEELYTHGIKSGKSGDRVVVASSGAWDYITTVPSHPGFEAYGYVAPTLADSNASGKNYSTFMVTAYDVLGRFVDSQVDSGFSVDNIAPAAPNNFVASNPATGIVLNWKANEEEDLAYYAIYKDTDPQPITRTTELFYVDTDIEEDVTYNYRLTVFDVNGNESASTLASVTVGVADRPPDAIPTDYALNHNYPNPFNPQTTIEFELPERGRAKVTIINTMGQEIATLVDSDLHAGYHSVVWDAKSHASGLYFYRITVNNFAQFKKMVLAK